MAIGESIAMANIVEKPPREEAPSNQAVVGCYVLSKFIWPLLCKTPLGGGDAIQLTDAIVMWMDIETVEAYRIVGKSHDCGTRK